MRRRRPKVKRDRDLTNGPGKLCLAMGIVGAMSGTSLRNGPVVIRAGDAVPDRDVVVTPRIGITQAADWPLRYLRARRSVRLAHARVLPADHLPAMTRFARLSSSPSRWPPVRAHLAVLRARPVALDEHPRSLCPRAPRVSRRVS